MLESMNFELKDISPERKGSTNVEVIQRDGALYIRPNGTGEHCNMEDGYPIMLEYYNGSLILYVWSDINNQDPTHIINLDKSKLSMLRK